MNNIVKKYNNEADSKNYTGIKSSVTSWQNFLDKSGDRLSDLADPAVASEGPL